MGWVANLLVIICVWRVAHRERWAFLCGVIGSCIWAFKAGAACQWDLLALNVVLGVLQLKGWCMWRER